MDKPNPSQKPSLKRRNFLLALGAGGAAGAAAVATGALTGKPVVPAVSAKAEPAPGYSETEHVHNYYRTTRI